MTRAQAKEFLTTNLGIESPTEEQITKYLDSVSDETKAEKARADKYKANAEKAEELQTKLDEIESQNLSDAEKANNALEKANARIEELERQSRISTQKSDAMAKFHITKEQADAVIGEDGSWNMDELGKIISEKETASANAKEQELAGNASNPNGGGASGSKEEKTEAEAVAETIGKSLSSSNEVSKSVIDSYL